VPDFSKRVDGGYRHKIILFRSSRKRKKRLMIYKETPEEVIIKKLIYPSEEKCYNEMLEDVIMEDIR
jgi:hypothetical protein